MIENFLMINLNLFKFHNRLLQIMKNQIINILDIVVFLIK